MGTRSLSLVGAALVSAVVLTACGDEVGTDLPIVDLPADLIYVTDSAGGLHVFDASTLARLGSLPVGDEPSEVHATPDGALVWVLSRGSNSISLIETATHEVKTVGVGVSPVHSYIAPDYGTIWVGNDGSASVSVIDVATRSLLETVITGAGHHKMAFATDAGGAFSFAYVSNITDGSITPVSAAREPLTNVPAVGPAPHGIDYAESTTYVYNCAGDIDPDEDGEQPGIEVIGTRDAEAHTIVERLPLQSGRCGYIHVDSGDAAYFSVGATGELGRLSFPGHEIETFDVGGTPDKFAIVGERAFVVDALRPIVTVVDLTGASANTTIATGQPVDPASPPTRAHRSIRYHGDRIYVPNAFDGTVSVIDSNEQAVVGILEGMSHPVNVAFAGPNGGSVYPR